MRPSSSDGKSFQGASLCILVRNCCAVASAFWGALAIRRSLSTLSESYFAVSKVVLVQNSTGMLLDTRHQIADSCIVNDITKTLL
jgi:hypothetical protein